MALREGQVACWPAGLPAWPRSFHSAGQQFVQTRCGKIGDTGEDVGEPGLGIDLVEATGRDHRQHDGGTVGATLAAGEGPVAPSQGDASQCALGTMLKGMMFSALKPGGEDWSSGLVCRSRDRGAGARNGGRPP